MRALGLARILVLGLATSYAASEHMVFAQSKPIVAETYYNTFSRAHSPLARIRPGETVSTKTIDASGRDETGTQRARPSNPLVDAELDAYPSGHTAYAVAWVVCAVVLVRAGTGWAVRFAAVTVALVLVAVVAVTRVYLRVHYVTDAIGGAALATAIWSLVAVLVLVGGLVRHNGRRVA